MRVEARIEDGVPAPRPQIPSSRGLGGEEEQPGDRGGVARKVGDTETMSHGRGEGWWGWLHCQVSGQGRRCSTGPGMTLTGTTSVTGWGLNQLAWVGAEWEVRTEHR